MSADDTLLLYTDGLVERRRENIDTGLARLVAHAGGLSGSLLQSSLDALVAALGASESADDVTAIAARYTGPLVQVQPIPPA